MREKNIYLVRHGQTDMNLQNRIQGQVDEYDLNEKGREQANLVKSNLEDALNKDVLVVSSPLKRASSTAKIISKTFELDNNFKEMYCGKYEGCEINEFNEIELDMSFKDYLSNDIIRVNDGKTLREYLMNFDKKYLNVGYPEGESKLCCAERFKNGIDLAIKTDVDNVIVVAHSLVIKSFLSRFVENSYSNVSHTDIIKLKYDGEKFTNND